MALPTAVKTWNKCLFNNSVTFVSLLATMGAVVTGTTNQLITSGMTCVGSSNGVTAAMDATNRCTTAAGFAVRATVAAAAQSWIVISDGVVQILFTYQGASDDVARISFSPGALFVVAGTATNQPTATDEQVFCNTTTLIGATASGNRVYHVWCDSTHRLWRLAVMSGGVVVGKLVGTELVDANQLVNSGPTPASAPIPVWGFAQLSSQLTMATLNSGFSANSNGGLAQFTVSGSAANISLGGVALWVSGSGVNLLGLNLELNGSVPAIRAIGLASLTTSFRGNVGNRFDWYFSDNFQPNGTLTAARDWVMLNVATGSTVGGAMWPWDGTTATCQVS